jgi:long-chain acyl-CoA synthetase
MGVPLRNIYGSTEIGLLTAHQGQAYDLETVGAWLPVHPRLGAPLEHRVSENGELLVRGGIGFAGYSRRQAGCEDASSPFSTGPRCAGIETARTRRAGAAI